MMITMKKRSVKGPPRIWVLKQKKWTTHLKVHLQLRIKQKQIENESR
jgi:hypothetical protein